jgi:hypothetical protein
MTDIIERLRKWTISRNAVPCGDLMDEAAAEIERLRNGAVENRETVQCPHVVGKTTLHCSLTPFTLTDEEREAVEWAEELAGNCEEFDRVDTLRNLLERTK